MKIVGAFCFSEEPSEDCSGDPEKILSSEGSEDVETSPPWGASLWLGVEDFEVDHHFYRKFSGFHGRRACGSWHHHNAPQNQPSSQPSLHFQKGNVNHVLHRTQEDRK